MAVAVSKNGKVFNNSNVWAQMNPQNINSPDMKRKFEQQEKFTDQTIETAQVPMSEEAILGYSQAMRNLPEYQNMVNENQTNINMRDAIANLPVSDRSGWVAPLAALTDTWTGSKLAGSVPKIEGNAELLINFQNKVDQDKKKQLETILSSMDKFKAGSIGTTKGVVKTTESGVGTGTGAGDKFKLTPAETKREEEMGKKVAQYDMGSLNSNLTLIKKIRKHAENLRTGEVNSGLSFDTAKSVFGLGGLADIEKDVKDAASRTLKEKFGGNPTNTEGQKAEEVILRKLADSDVNADSLDDFANYMESMTSTAIQAKRNMDKTGYASVARAGATAINSADTSEIQGGSSKTFTRQEASDYGRQYGLSYSDAVKALESHGFSYDNK